MVLNGGILSNGENQCLAPGGTVGVAGVHVCTHFYSAKRLGRWVSVINRDERVRITTLGANVHDPLLLSHPTPGFELSTMTTGSTSCMWMRKELMKSRGDVGCRVCWLCSTFLTMKSSSSCNSL